MYSTVGLLKNSKQSGKLVGTHQKLDRTARRLFSHLVPAKTFFPAERDILHFEGNRGPDGLKRKSPGVDEPMHFIQPENDDGKLIRMILDHQSNLRAALIAKNYYRAALEAAWMAHAITDGLTPAHHYPFLEATEDLITSEEFVKIFGAPIKGIMKGKSMLDTARNNWLYWGARGFMTKHIAFEYGCAITAAAMSTRALTPALSRPELKNIDLKKEFYRSLHKISTLDMYDRFLKDGWTTNLAYEAKDILLPEIVRAITIGWISSLPDGSRGVKNVKK